MWFGLDELNLNKNNYLPKSIDFHLQTDNRISGLIAYCPKLKKIIKIPSPKILPKVFSHWASHPQRRSYAHTHRDAWSVYASESATAKGNNLSPSPSLQHIKQNDSGKKEKEKELSGARRGGRKINICSFLQTSNTTHWTVHHAVLLLACTHY